MQAAGGDTYPPGTLLDGKYRVERVLGQGAMGTVVAAVHEELGERRALKLLRSQWLLDREKVERFSSEARAAARLRSQHVARIFDVGRLPTGVPFIVLEYLDGCDLASYLAARGTLPIATAASIVMQACEALDEAHALGIVHRDLKPANLFIEAGEDGEPSVKVLDFGVAKVSRGDDVAGTHPEAFLGTPLYMSPEQVRSTRDVDARSDVWALGAILYTSLTGQTPFVAASVAELSVAILGHAPIPPRSLRADIPPELEATVLKCLEKDPARRFASASELAMSLARFDRYRPAVDPFVKPVPVMLTGNRPPSLGSPASAAETLLDSSSPSAVDKPRTRLGPGPLSLLVAGVVAGTSAGMIYSFTRARGERAEATSLASALAAPSAEPTPSAVATPSIRPVDSSAVSTPPTSSAAPSVPVPSAHATAASAETQAPQHPVPAASTPSPSPSPATSNKDVWGDDRR